MFITAFIRAGHPSLFWARSIQSNPTAWRSILVLFFHLRLGLPNSLFPSGFSTKTPYTPLLSPLRATCPAHLILLDFITRNVFGEECRSLCRFLHYPVISSLLHPKCSPQHTILNHSQPTFLPQCERPGFTPMQNNIQNYNYVYLNLYIFV